MMSHIDITMSLFDITMIHLDISMYQTDIMMTTATVSTAIPTKTAMLNHLLNNRGFYRA